MTMLEAPVNVEFGNHSRINAIDGRPAVTYLHVPAAYTYEEGLSGADLRAGLEASIRRAGGQQSSNFPDHEAIIPLTHPAGHWGFHSLPGLRGAQDPAWVWSDHEDIQRLLSEFYQCPEGRPGMVDELYWRKAGSHDLAPGVLLSTISPDMNLTNAGRGVWANTLGGGATGATGTGTTASSNTLTTASTYTTNQWAGYKVIVNSGSGLVWGNIVSNNNTSSASVLTVDQWYAVPETGSAGTTPASGFQFIIISGGATSAWYIGLTTTNITPAATDTSLLGESTVSGMGRKIATFALTSGTTPASYTISATYTLGTAGLLTFYAMGAFTSSVKTAGVGGNIMVFESSFTASFSVQNVNDQATVTDTVSGS